jgi:hypothetical protein
VAVGLVAVSTPLGSIFGFGSLPPAFYVFLGVAVAVSLLLVETVQAVLLARFATRLTVITD